MRLLLIIGAMVVGVMAALTEKETENRQPESLYKEAAEACYKDCHAAEIMSFSTSYWKHRSPMTILDRAARFLIEVDFLQMNDTYFVNHIAVENEEPIGLGCFALETPSEFSLYPVDDPICSSTRSVVCGMPSIMGSPVDSQKIADAVHTLTTPANATNSSDTVNPDDGKNNHTTVTHTSSINLAEIMTQVTSNDSPADTNHSITDVDGTTEDEQTMTEEKEEDPFFTEDESDEENFSTGNFQYSVIRLSQQQDSSSSASLLCNSQHDKIGSLYSSSIPAFSAWFQRTHPSAKLIIESWNGDNYGSKDAQCLMFSSSQGVHLSECTDASMVLCEG